MLSAILLTMCLVSSVRAVADSASVALPTPDPLNLNLYFGYPATFGDPTSGSSCATQADGSFACVQFQFGPLISSVDPGCPGAVYPFVYEIDTYGPGGQITIGLNNGQAKFTGSFTSAYGENVLGCGYFRQDFTASFTLDGYSGGGTLSGFASKFADTGSLQYSGTVVPEPGTFVGMALGMLTLGTVGWRRISAHEGS